MVTETIKSDVISKLDATPVIRATAGEGGPGIVRSTTAYLTPTSGKTAGSKYQIARIPTTARVKSLIVAGAAQTVGKYDFGLYYSSSATDGTPAAYNNGTLLNVSFFASDYSFASAVNDANITNLKDYTMDKRNQPIWQAAGLTADPGGYLDICATLTTTLTTGAVMGANVEFVI